ncbi:protein NLRC3-like [Amblyraja radiata]|uniref:protein NLRC3-like n=1 Tax=Amblyraja radiata TaxID=386614 RepID=UPI0014039E97|nr:protein NLRC3-like [Amblyraja radiata]
MSSMTELLEWWDDWQLLDLTNHYRQRLEEAIQDALENVVFVLAYERYFSEQDYKQVIKRTKRGSRAAGSRLLVNLVTEKEPRVRKLIWKCFVKMHHLLPKLDELLKAMGEEGSDLIESFKARKASWELPAHLKDVQQKHMETLKAQTETLSVNTILMKEKVKVFQLLDRNAELTIISTVRDRTLVEHELLARGIDHEEWREEHLGGEFEKIRTDQLFQSKSKSGSSSAVAGVPGIGKTTMVQKIVHDWATGKIYQQFQFVFSFKFRDLNTIKGRRVPKTITQLYCYYIYNILKNHGREIESPRDVLLRLGQMAFTGVAEKNIVFTDEDLTTYNLQPSQFLSGFLMELLEREGSARSVVYTFPHLTIQEFVAALAQFMTPHSGDIKTLPFEAHSMTDGRFEVFLRFVAGLSSPRSAWILEEFLGKFPRETICRVIDWVKEEVKRRAGNTESEAGKRSFLNTLHYLFESQNPALAKQTLGSVETLSFSGLGLTPIDCAVLSHVIGFCDTIKHVDLWRCRIQCEGLQRLGPALHKCQNLRLGDNDLGDSGVKLVSAALRNPDCKIQTLWLQRVGLTDYGAEGLVSALHTNHSLTELKLALNSLTDRCVPALRCLILNHPNLEQIKLGENQFSPTGKKELRSLQEPRPRLSVDV